MTSNYYTVREFAQVLNVHRNTVYRAIRSGNIVALKLSQGKNSTYRIPKSETERMAIADLKKIMKNFED